MTCDSTTDDLLTAEFFKLDHDPSGALQGPWRFLIECAPNVQPSVVSVVAVDEENHPITFDATGVDGDSLVISLTSVVQATDIAIPNVWAIQFYTQFGSPKQVGYRIRARYTLNTTPATGRDLTMILRCTQG